MKENDQTTYERLMRSAVKLFAQKGFDGTTTREIVADARSSLSSLQAHFQSKEMLHQAVIARTIQTFYKLNVPIIDEVNEAEAQGILTPNMAWNLIVELTSQMVEWAFHEEYRDEILVINREIMSPDKIYQDLPEQLYGPFNCYNKLFEVYTGQKDQFWIKALVFSTVTAIVGIVNYPRVMSHALDCDMDLPENRKKLKMHMKNYLLTSIQAMLRERGIE